MNNLYLWNPNNMLTFCFFINIAFTYCYTVEPVPPKPDREYVGQFFTTRYYTPVPWQDAYYSGSYDNDYRKNCGGDCLITANWYRLKKWDEYRVFACPKTFDFWTRLFVEGVGEGVCFDRGGSIKNRRLDIWVGIGDNGIQNLYSRKGYDTIRKVYIINK